MYLIYFLVAYDNFPNFTASNKPIAASGCHRRLLRGSTAMKKEETIKMYQEAFLAGRSENARQAFLAKSPQKQYSCIMAWRHRMRHTNRTTDGSGIIDHLRVAHKKMNAATDINEQELLTIRTELAAIRDGLDVFAANRKAREIQELEKQQAEIAERLRSLKATQSHE